MEEEVKTNTTSTDMEDISSVSSKLKKKRIIKIVLIVLAILLVLSIIAGIVLNAYVNNLLNKNINTDKTFNESNLAVNSNAFAETDEEEKFTSDYTNIALFGIDTRQDCFVGRSDTIIILTIDKKHNKIKMTSIARDSYVPIDGHGKDKLTHAYAYGRAELAVKTLNQVYNFDITDYVTVNFFGFEKMIDYIGGLDLYVDQSVLNEINMYANKAFDLEYNDYDKIPGTGLQHLNGGQALAFSRTRHNTGGDLGRAGRQRDVLDAALDKVRNMGASKLPELIRIGLKNSETSFEADEIKELGTWALLNDPVIETYAVPDSDCHPKSGKDCYIGNRWYYIYDLDIATNKIHDFIKEEGTYKPQNETESK